MTDRPLQPAPSSCARRSPAAWRIPFASLVALILFAVTLKIPVSHSDADLATIGRVQNCGFPFPWIRYAPGLSITQSLDAAKFWLLPVNLAFWVLLSAILFRLRTLRRCALCMAVAQAPLLLFLLLRAI